MKPSVIASTLHVPDSFSSIFRHLRTRPFAPVRLDKLPDIEALSHALNLTLCEVLVVAVVFSLEREQLGKSPMHLFALTRPYFYDFSELHDVIEDLRKVNLLEETHRDNHKEYSLPRRIYRYLKFNQIAAIAAFKPVGLVAVLTYFNNRILDNSRFDQFALQMEMDYLQELNPDLPLIAQTHGTMFWLQSFLILATCTRKYFNNEPFGSDYISQYCSNKSDVRYLLNLLQSGELTCIRAGHLRTTGTGLLDSQPLVELTEEGEHFFMDGLSSKEAFDRPRQSKPLPAHALQAKTIPKVKMLFNDHMTQQVQELEAMLMPAFFGRYLESLRPSARMRGLTVLLHGAPGTGKTELALQLARKTGRALFRIDISQLLSKWVGDSEKNLRARFTEYRRYQAQTDPAPILFLNECDQLLSRRTTVNQSVDQMRNTLQNMLLEEMENFHGILLATTNMTHNLDPAFERRFLYKIRFQAPDQTMRSQLWKAILPRLKPEQAEQLAAQFPYTPGEMQNIATKLRLRRMLNPKTKYFETVLGLCREEKWGEEKTTRMGFKSL